MSSYEVHIAAQRVTLAGTLQSADDPRGGVLLLNGSGPLDRDSNMPGQRLDVAKTLAHALEQAGLTSLRIDKRGVGGSTGDALTGGFHDETADARAALDYLAEVVAGPLVVAGHSMGGTIALRLATHARVEAVVLLATPAQPLRTVIPWQTERITESLPGPSWAVPRFLQALQRRTWQEIEESTDDTIRRMFKRHPARWFREALDHDPRDDLAALMCPLLAITGRKDLQVDADDVATMAATVQGPFHGETPSQPHPFASHRVGPGRDHELRQPIAAAGRSCDDRVGDLLAGAARVVSPCDCHTEAR